MKPNNFRTNLTEKQRRAWQMRYAHGWRLERIALHMNITKSAVWDLLQRAHTRAGLTQRVRNRVRAPTPRVIRALSLSSSFDV